MHAFLKHQDTVFLIYLFFGCACGDSDRFSLLPRWLLVMHSQCMPRFCFACQWTVCNVHNNFNVCGVYACGSRLRLYVCLMCGAALLRVVYRKHPNLSSHCTVCSTSSVPQGYRYCYDLSTQHVWFVIWSTLSGLLFDGLVFWFEIATE